MRNRKYAKCNSILGPNTIVSVFKTISLWKWKVNRNVEIVFHAFHRGRCLNFIKDVVDGQTGLHSIQFIFERMNYATAHSHKISIFCTGLHRTGAKLRWQGAHVWPATTPIRCESMAFLFSFCRLWLLAYSLCDVVVCSPNPPRTSAHTRHGRYSTFIASLICVNINAVRTLCATRSSPISMRS